MNRKPSERAQWSVLVALCLSFHAVHAASCENVRVVVSGYCSNVHVACSGGSAYATSHATGALENLPLARTMLGGCPLRDNPTCAYTRTMTSRAPTAFTTLLPSNSSSPRNTVSLLPA